MDLELDLGPEMTTSPHDLRWDIDGTGPRDRVDHKLRSQSCNQNTDLELDPDLGWIPAPKKKLTSHCYSYGDKNLRW